ncbi:hypothetical protein [Halobacillus sp. Marseille-P3879]|uniref:hypothetical protein n=1 Tax=Halobacillus TaxID=45667 RepID=UPI000C7C2662|nr:hypothetical protein [Halobacillus sp. Marseille-P3879]
MGHLVIGVILIITYLLIVLILSKNVSGKLRLKTDDNLIKKFPVWLLVFALSLVFLTLSKVLNTTGGLVFEFATYLMGVIIICGIILYVLVRPLNRKVYQSITSRL